jgi:predicted secreted protein
MAITSALVLFAVIWFMVLFIVLPIRLKSQADTGEVVPGTHASAPDNPQLKKRALIVTAITVVLWVIVVGIIVSGAVTVRDIDMFNKLNPSVFDDGTNG